MKNQVLLRKWLLPGLAAVFILSLVYGQTAGPVKPVGKAPLETGWKTQTITDGIMHPWSAVWLPDGETILITEREGRLRVFEKGRLHPDPVAGLPEILPVGQGGLLDIVLHPDFARNRYLYFTASTGTPQANRTTLFRARISSDLRSLTEVTNLFQVSQDKKSGQHFGSRLLWLKDGSLLLSIGDGGNPPLRLEGKLIRENAQNLSSHLGKILRLDEDGRPLKDNPYYMDKDPSTDPYIYSYGHRNIQGLALHPATGEVWASEHGARGGDELNIIRKGMNYGWPLATYSVEYSGQSISALTSLRGAADPAAVWTPCIAPSGLIFYTGGDFPQWRGDLFSGGLVLKQIRRLDMEKGRIIGQTTFQFDERIRWVGQGPDGGLYVLTDEIDGRLFRIIPQ